MIRLILLPTLVLAPAALRAQATSCGWEFGRWVCRPQTGQMPSLQSPDMTRNMLESYRQAQEMRRREDLAQQEREALQALQALQAAQDAERNSQEAREKAFVADIDTRKRMGELLRAGNCSAAIDESLKAGDIKLAGEVQAFCAARTPAP
jgi:transposase